MTTHLPTADVDMAEANMSFEQMERWLLLYLLREDAASACVQTAVLRVLPTIDEAQDDVNL